MKNKFNVIAASLVLSILFLRFFEIFCLGIEYNLFMGLSKVVVLRIINEIILVVFLFKNNKKLARWPMLGYVLINFVLFRDISMMIPFLLLFILSFVEFKKQSSKWVWILPVVIELVIKGAYFMDFEFSFGRYFSVINVLLDVSGFLFVVSQILLVGVLGFWFVLDKSVNVQLERKRKVSSKNTSKQDKIKGINDLYNSGAITEKEYKKRTLEILKNKK